MAVIGVKYPVFSPITAERTASANAIYGVGIVLGKAMNISIAETYLTCSELAKRKSIFQSANVVVGVTQSPTEAWEKCFGSADVSGGIVKDELIAGVPGGFGYITEEINGGVRRYCVHWIKHIVFLPPNLSAVSKGKNTTMTTESLTGIADSDGSDSWRERRFYDTASQAVSYLRAKAGVTI